MAILKPLRCGAARIGLVGVTFQGVDRLTRVGLVHLGKSNNRRLQCGEAWQNVGCVRRAGCLVYESHEL